jgi:hypothetical protein
MEARPAAGPYPYASAINGCADYVVFVASGLQALHPTTVAGIVGLI